MEFYTKAQNIVSNTKSVFYYFHDKREMFIEAAEHFEKAGNSYKMNNEFELATKCYIDAFKILKNNNIHIYETIDYLSKAAENENNIIKKVKLFFKLIKYCNKIGNIDKSEKYLLILAKIFENDNNFEEALKIYQILVETYTKDGPTKNSYKFKIFQYSTKLEMSFEEILKNGKMLEEIGNSCKKYTYTSSNYYFNSVLCYLSAGDIVLTTQKFDILSYQQLEFVKNIINSIEIQDIEMFADICFNYDNIYKLDATQTILLLIVKKQFVEEVDLS